MWATGAELALVGSEVILTTWTEVKGRGADSAAASAGQGALRGVGSGEAAVCRDVCRESLQRGEAGHE